MQIKLITGVSFLLSLLLAAAAPVIFGIRNLDETATAYVLERYLILSGALLFTPLFFPEQNPNIRELTESKRMGSLPILLNRVLQSVLLLIVLLSTFLGIMSMSGCTFGFGKMLFGTLSSALFLGALGFLTCAVIGNLVAGYLVPAGYFILNFFAGDKLGSFYLFSMSAGSSQNKLWLLLGAVFLFALSFGWRHLVQKLR